MTNETVMDANSMPDRAEDEALAIFTEEAAEAIKAVSKIRRHGFVSTGHPDDVPLPESNALTFTREVGDLLGAIDVLIANGILHRQQLEQFRVEKLRKLKKYTHSCNLPDPDDPEILR